MRYLGLTVGNSGITIVGGINLDVLGVTDTGSSALVVNGNCADIDCGSALATQNPFAVSDRRLKSDIEPVTRALSKVTKLKGVYYKWVAHADHKDADNRRHIGLIAQDVQHIVPEAVGQVLGGKMLGVDYEALVPLLIEAVGELERENELDSITLSKMKSQFASDFSGLQSKANSMK